MKNAADHDDSLLSPEVSAEKMNEINNSVSDTSLVSMEMYSDELGEGSLHESAAASLNEFEEDKDDGRQLPIESAITESYIQISL